MKFLQSEILECKAFNHAWEPCALPKIMTTMADSLHLVCIRCGSEKAQGIGAGGYLNSTTYRLSPVYEQVKDQFDRQGARAELYKRQKKEVRHLKAVPNAS